MAKQSNTKRREITNWLDTTLNHANIPDYPTAHNGLQVENNGEVKIIAAAVDASLDTIRIAAEQNVDLLIVHHGLFWQGVEMLTGSWREKCKILLDNNIAIYSSHIPLDIHPQFGNNVLLAKALGLTQIEHCINWKGIKIAVKGALNKNRDLFTNEISDLLNIQPHTCLRGDAYIEELYIITGGAGSQIKTIYETGGRSFLTGEGSQWTIPYAEEKEMNYFLANHYATELLGVEAIAKEASKGFLDSCPAIIKTKNQL